MKPGANIWYGRDGRPLDTSYAEIERLLSDPNYKIVSKTDLGDAGTVSTVWLGLDHSFGSDGPPLIFETLVFGGDLDGEMDRYATLDDARAGHQKMVGRVAS